MVMLLPGVGELNLPSRVRLTIALVLTAILLPSHQKAYTVDLTALAPVLTMLFQEIVIGAVLGLTARLAISALQVAGSVVAQQLGLGFVTAIDPTQNQQGMLVGNFLTVLGITLIFATDLHHLVIAAMNDSYTIFQPGEMPLVGDAAQHVTRIVATAFRIGIQLSAPFLVFGLLFNLGFGVLSRLMPQMQVFFIGLPLSILLGLLLLLLVIGAMMGTFVGYLEGVLGDTRAARLTVKRAWPKRHRHHRENRRPDAKAPGRRAQARRRGQEPGGQYLVHHRRRHAGADGVLRQHERRPHHHHARADRQCARYKYGRAGAAAAVREDRRRTDRGRRHSVPAADAGGARRQPDPAQADLVARGAGAQAVQNLAGRRLQAAVLQAGARQFRQGPRQAGAGRLGAHRADVARARPHHGARAHRSGGGAAARPVAGAQADGRRGRHDGGGGARRLPVPIPAVVREAENVAAGIEGGIQAERRRSGHQGQDEAGAPDAGSAGA